MANSIDFGTLTLGALVGIGCHKQLKSCGRVVATTAANLAGVAATAAQQVAKESFQSPEAAAPEAAAASAVERTSLRGNYEGSV